MYDITKHYQCHCHSELIQVTRDKEPIDMNDKSKGYLTFIYFAKFHYGTQNHAYSLKELLRHIWRMIRTRSPYADDVILNITEARRLGEDLIKMCEGEKTGDEDLYEEKKKL